MKPQGLSMKQQAEADRVLARSRELVANRPGFWRWFFSLFRVQR